MFDLLVVGAGYTGGALARHFASEGKKVAGIVRSDESKEALERDCIVPVLCDLTQPDTLTDIPSAESVFISLSPDKREEKCYEEIYVKAVGNFLDSVKSNPPKKMIYISSTGVYGSRNGEWVDEHADPKPDSKRSEILLEAEKKILRSDIPAMVLRLGGIYGPGRNRIQAVREGKFPDSPNHYVNLIYVQDIIRLAVFFFENFKSGEIYLGVDDEPVKQSEFYSWLCKRLNVPNQFIDRGTQEAGKRCRNTKVRSLGFEFLYPDFKKGYEAILKGACHSRVR